MIIRTERYTEEGRVSREKSGKARQIPKKDLAFYIKFKDNYKALAHSINPSIRPEQAEKAIKLLKKLGLIKKGKNGYYERVEPVITTGPEVQSLNVANFQKAMMNLAKQAFDRHPKEHRDISTLTLSIDRETFGRMKAETMAFRKKFLNMAVNVKNPDCVYQLNYNFFPLSKL